MGGVGVENGCIVGRVEEECCCKVEIISVVEIVDIRDELKVGGV